MVLRGMLAGSRLFDRQSSKTITYTVYIRPRTRLHSSQTPGCLCVYTYIYILVLLS